MMKYTIKVSLNEKGSRLIGKDCYFKHVDLEYGLTEKEAQEMAEEDVPKELINEVTVIPGGLNNLEVGDYVKLTEYASRDLSCSGSRLMEVAEMRDTVIIIKDYPSHFNYDGTERDRRKKYPSTISIPTKEELEEHRYIIKHEKLIGEITELIEDCELFPLKNDKLEEILGILKGNKKGN